MSNQRTPAEVLPYSGADGVPEMFDHTGIIRVRGELITDAVLAAQAEQHPELVQAIGGLMNMALMFLYVREFVVAIQEVPGRTVVSTLDFNMVGPDMVNTLVACMQRDARYHRLLEVTKGLTALPPAQQVCPHGVFIVPT